MKPETKLIGALLFGAILGGAAVYLNADNRGAKAFAQALLTHKLPKAKDGGVVIGLCDGVTSTEVRGLKPGQQMSREQAMAVSRKLMAEWQRKHPGEHWIMAQADTGKAAQAADQPAASPSGSENIPGPSTAGGTQAKSQQGDTYASFHNRDFVIFRTETDAFVEQGRKIFHSSQLLGGTIGISCDMCHPDGANTHAETYPKYQEQLQRVALLRDMINWCIENPVKGKTLDSNDPRLRALEAYILAQRKGVPLEYGKH